MKFWMCVDTLHLPVSSPVFLVGTQEQKMPGPEGSCTRAGLVPAGALECQHLAKMAPSSKEDLV